MIKNVKKDIHKFPAAVVQKTLGKKAAFSFSCTKCGNCCREEGDVYFTSEDLEKIYEYLQLKGNKKNLLYKKLIQKKENNYHVHETPDSCYFLSNRGTCTIYPVRLLQCSTFPFWPSIFAAPKNLAEAAKGCPGITNGITNGIQNETQKDTSYSPEETAEKISFTQKEFLEPQTNPKEYRML